MLRHIKKVFWHPNLHLFSSYQHMLGELVTSTVSLIESYTWQIMFGDHLWIFGPEGQGRKDRFSNLASESFYKT